MVLTPKTKLQLLEFLDVFKTIGIAVLLVLAVQSLYNENRQIENTARQITATKAIVSQINTNSKIRTKQINDLQRHIDCIASLFQRPDRTSLTITDLEDCQISDNNTGQTTISPLPAKTDSTTVAPTPKPTTTSSPPPSDQNTSTLCLLTLHLINCN